MNALERILELLRTPDEDHISSIYYETIVEIREIVTEALATPSRDRRKGMRFQITERRRIDPPGCGCTDCIIGDSVPDRRRLP